MNVPAWLLVHRITVEPYRGNSAYGPLYGDAVEHAAMVSEAVKVTRAPDGTQAVSTAQVITAPDLDCPPDSRVTLPSGRVTRALTVAHHTAPGLPVPQSTEVMCE